MCFACKTMYLCSHQFINPVIRSFIHNENILAPLHGGYTPRRYSTSAWGITILRWDREGVIARERGALGSFQVEDTITQKARFCLVEVRGEGAERRPTNSPAQRGSTIALSQETASYYSSAVRYVCMHIDLCIYNNKYIIICMVIEICSEIYRKRAPVVGALLAYSRQCRLY